MAAAMIRDLLRPRTQDQRFASIAAMERAARRRIPGFAHDYMAGGIGREDGLARNLSALDGVRFMPRYLTEVAPPELTAEILGRKFAAPFGAGPVGLTGLMWPDAPKHIARAAAARNLPVGLSTYGTASIEEIGAIAGPLTWFQLYPMKDEAIEQDLLARFAAVGGEVLLVTVDIPGHTRRERDIANGLSVPPRRDWRTWMQCAMRPGWSLATLRAGIPQFRNLTRYVPEGADTITSLAYSNMAANVSPARLRRYRDLWKGKLVIKGVLDTRDAEVALDCGVDGIVVSNHGGRQLDAAPTAPEALPPIREAVGDRLAVLADGGARSGLDIARLLAKGADFVLLGRAMTCSVAAMGPSGPAHALHVLTEELHGTLCQIGCSDHRELAGFLHE
ncbi:MAG TPA: alpha-hydroxy acid oxidase [Paracoccaceae bacterium]|nr:alpha-hydroxy acid oxidase [Paracoccaceae bacterium]